MTRLAPRTQDIEESSEESDASEDHLVERRRAAERGGEELMWTRTFSEPPISAWDVPGGVHAGSYVRRLRSAKREVMKRKMDPYAPEPVRRVDQDRVQPSSAVAAARSVDTVVPAPAPASATTSASAPTLGGDAQGNEAGMAPGAHRSSDQRSASGGEEATAAPATAAGASAAAGSGEVGVGPSPTQGGEGSGSVFAAGPPAAATAAESDGSDSSPPASSALDTGFVSSDDEERAGGVRMSDLARDPFTGDAVPPRSPRWESSVNFGFPTDADAAAITAAQRRVKSRRRQQPQSRQPLRQRTLRQERAMAASRLRSTARSRRDRWLQSLPQRAREDAVRVLGEPAVGADSASVPGPAAGQSRRRPACRRRPRAAPRIDAGGMRPTEELLRGDGMRSAPPVEEGTSPGRGEHVAQGVRRRRPLSRHSAAIQAAADALGGR